MMYAARQRAAIPSRVSGRADGLTGPPAPSCAAVFWSLIAYCLMVREWVATGAAEGGCAPEVNQFPGKQPGVFFSPSATLRVPPGLKPGLPFRVRSPRAKARGFHPSPR
jgi:hypothetical protein